MVKGKDQAVGAGLRLGWALVLVNEVAPVPLVGRVRETAALHRIFEGVVADQRPHLTTVFGRGVGRRTRASSPTSSRGGVRILRGDRCRMGENVDGPFTSR